MHKEEDKKNNSADYAALLLEATFKTWDFLEESGFVLDELVGKNVFFIVGTPDGGGRRLGINNLMREIEEAASAGKTCELRFLQAVVRDSEDSTQNSPWEDARFPVSQPPPPRHQKITDKFHEFEELFPTPPPAEETTQESQAFLTEQEQALCLAALEEAKNQGYAWKSKAAEVATLAFVAFIVLLCGGLILGIL